MENRLPTHQGLNVAVMHIASRLFPCGYDVSADAPDTFERLCDHLDNGGRMVVWNGASDRTVFECPEVNWAFRAWHDWHHWKGRLPFTPEGEAEACRRQIADLVRLYGDSVQTRRWALVLDAEINGQLRYAALNGDTFPTDQAAFVNAYLADPEAALAQRF